jgi:hypothetical protein
MLKFIVSRYERPHRSARGCAGRFQARAAVICDPPIVTISPDKEPVNDGAVR